MARSQWLLLFTLIHTLFATACAPKSSNSSNNFVLPKKSSTIVGGKELSESDLLTQHLVGIYDSAEGQICSGTLINENVVLTAAHCVGSDPQTLYIFFGPKIEVGTLFAKVDKAEVSPYWNSESSVPGQMGDLALLRFTGKLPSSHSPAPLLPLSLSSALAENTVTTVAGYGVTDGITKEGAQILRQASVTIANANYGPSEVLINQSTGQGVCHGDSGGPAFVEIRGVQYLWGITSRGIGTRRDDCNQYAAMTNTLAHRTWINRMNARLSSPLIQLEWGDED